MAAYYLTPESVREYISLAEGFDGKELILKLRDYLPEGSKILELGSGPGKDWVMLNEYYDAVGSDFSGEFLKHLSNTYPGHSFLPLEASTLDTDQRFQAIYSNKVLHHLDDPSLGSSFTRQAEILLEEGVICHSFWKGEGNEEFKGMFVNYHLEDGLRSFLEPDFEILLLESYKEFEPEDSLLVIAKKKSSTA